LTRASLYKGCGSGITAPLGLISTIKHWSALVFVTREPEHMFEVVVAARSMDIQGGMFGFITTQSYEWPNVVLLREIPFVIQGGKKWIVLEPVYQEFLRLSTLAFPGSFPGSFPGFFPVLRSAHEMQEFVDQLQEWSSSHSFANPHEGVTVHLGRPLWSDVLSQLGDAAYNAPVLSSEVSFNFHPGDNLPADNSIVLKDIHLLYTGAAAPLRDIKKWVQGAIKGLFSNLPLESGSSRCHWEVHAEVW
jgi:hypothetical protein